MDSAKVCLLLVLLVGICAGQQDLFLHSCSATGCQFGGTCDDATGVCTCTDPVTQGGLYCEIDLTATCTDAAITCDAGAGETCGVVKATAEEKCLCAPGFTTQFSAGIMECTVLRFEAFCPGSAVEGSLYTYLGVDFAGTVYQVADVTDLTQKCLVPSTIDGDGRMTFTQNIDGVVTYPDCTDKGITFPDQTAEDTRSLFVYIQYIPNVDATFNDLFEFRCTIRDDGSVVSETFNVGYEQITSALISGSIYLNGGGVEIAGFLNFKGVPVKAGEIMTVGNELEVAIYKTIVDSTYGIWNLHKMTSKPSETATDAESLILIENGCATKAGKILIKSIQNIPEITQQITGVKSSAVKVAFKGHKFDSSIELWLLLEYKLCLIPATCVTACPGGKYEATVADPTARRRKRAVSDVTDGADGAQVPMNFTVNIYDSTGAGKNSWTGAENTDISSCVQSIVFIVPLILLVVLVVVAMAIAVYFFTKLNRQRNKSDAMDNMAYKS